MALFKVIHYEPPISIVEVEVTNLSSSAALSHSTSTLCGRGFDYAPVRLKFR